MAMLRFYDSHERNPRKVLASRALTRHVAKGQTIFVNMQPNEELLTPQELAARLKVKVSWVYEQSRSRAGIRNPTPLPYRKVGKYLRFAWSEIVEWLDKLQAA